MADAPMPKQIRSKHTIKGADSADEETQEILKEMEEAGELEAADEDLDDEEESDDDGDDDGDADEEADGEEEEDKSKKKPAKKPKAGKAGDKDDADDDEDAEDEEDDDDDDEGEDPELEAAKQRKPKFVKLEKHKKKIENLKERHQQEIQSYEQKIKDLSKSASEGEEVDDEVKAIAKEYGIPEESLSKIVDLTAKKLSGAGLTEKQKRQLARLEEEDDERVQESGFQKELKVLAKEDEAIREHEEELREMAFSEEYGGLSLYEIFNRHLKPTLQPKKKTAEGGRGGSRSKSTTYTDEEIAADPDLQQELSDDEFDSWSERMAKKSKSTIRRDGKPIKRG